MTINKCHQVKVVGLVLVILITPVLINFILICHNPIPFNTVAGDASNWIGFYGSYAGSLIGLLGSVYIFVRQLKESFRQRIQEQRLLELKLIKKDLVERFSTVQFKKILAYIDDGLQYNRNKELERLVTLRLEADNAYNTAVILYRDKTSEAFFESYETCIEKYNRLLEKTIELVKSTNNNGYGYVTDAEKRIGNFNTTFKSLKQEMEEADTYFRTLGYRAQDLIDEMEKQIKSYNN